MASFWPRAIAWSPPSRPGRRKEPDCDVGPAVRLVSPRRTGPSPDRMPWKRPSRVPGLTPRTRPCRPHQGTRKDSSYTRSDREAGPPADQDGNQGWGGALTDYGCPAIVLDDEDHAPARERTICHAGRVLAVLISPSALSDDDVGGAAVNDIGGGIAGDWGRDVVDRDLVRDAVPLRGRYAGGGLTDDDGIHGDHVFAAIALADGQSSPQAAVRHGDLISTAVALNHADAGGAAGEILGEIANRRARDVVDRGRVPVAAALRDPQAEAGQAEADVV